MSDGHKKKGDKNHSLKYNGQKLTKGSYSEYNG